MAKLTGFTPQSSGGMNGFTPTAYVKSFAAETEEDRPWYEDAYEVGRQATAGAVVDVPRMAGQVIRRVSPDGSTADNYGREMVEAADERAPGWEPDTRGERGMSRILSKGARGLAPMVPAIAASLVPGGQWVAPTVAATQFGLSAAQDTEDKLRSQGIADDEATAAGWRTGAIQGPLEGVATAVGMRAFKPLAGMLGAAKPSMAGITEAVTNRDLLKPFAKSMGINAVVQPGTEVAQDTGTELVERAYGAKPQDLGAIAKDSAEGGLGMTLLLGPFGFMGHMSNSKRAAQLDYALSDPEAPVALRQQAENYVTLEARKAGVSADQAKTWWEGGTPRLDENKQRDLLGDGTLDADLNQRQLNDGLAEIFPEAETPAVAKARRSAYEQQLNEAASEPSGRMVSDADTGLESQLDMGQMFSQQVPLSPAEQAAKDASDASLRYEQGLQQHAASLGVPPKVAPGLKAVRMLEDVKDELTPEQYGAIEGVIKAGQYGTAIETLNKREKTLANAAKEQQRAAEKAQKEAQRATEKAEKEAKRDQERAEKAATPTAAEIAVEEDTPTPAVKESLTTAPKTLANGQVVRQVAPAAPVAPVEPKADFRTTYRAANTKIAALRAERKKLVVLKDASGKEVKGSEAAIGDLGDVDATSPTGKRVAQIDNEINAALPPVADIRAHVASLLATSTDLSLKQRLSAVTGITQGEGGLEQAASPVPMAEVARAEGVTRQSISKQMHNAGLSDLHIGRLVANTFESAKEDHTVEDEHDASSDSGSDTTAPVDREMADGFREESTAAKAAGEGLVQGDVLTQEQARKVNALAAKVRTDGYSEDSSKEAVSDYQAVIDNPPTQAALEHASKMKSAIVAKVADLKLKDEGKAKPQTAPTESDLEFEAKRKEAAVHRGLAEFVHSPRGRYVAADWNEFKAEDEPAFEALTTALQLDWVGEYKNHIEGNGNDYESIKQLQRNFARGIEPNLSPEDAATQGSLDTRGEGPGGRPTKTGGGSGNASAPTTTPVVTKARPKVVRDANGRRIEAKAPVAVEVQTSQGLLKLPDAHAALAKLDARIENLESLVACLG